MIRYCQLAAVVPTAAALIALSGPAMAGQPGAMNRTPVLDGMTFTGKLGPEGQPKDVEDRFVFADGTFVSKECELRCEYPARPYRVRETGGGIEFVSRTKCPYKDATIVWRGTVKDGRIEGVATWTINRWYWTIERNFEFSGGLEGTAPAMTSVD